MNENLQSSADAGKPSEVHMSERGFRGFGVMIEFLERGQREGGLRKRRMR
jgi:hypothetical protein